MRCALKSSVSCTLQVDATVIAGFTALSTFQHLATQSQAKHRAVLEHALHSIGIDVRKLPSPQAHCTYSERSP